MDDMKELQSIVWCHAVLYLTMHEHLRCFGAAAWYYVIILDMCMLMVQE